MTHLYVVGDIHGEVDKLNRLLVKIFKHNLNLGGDGTIVFVGDYVDRGPDSRGVVETLIRVKEDNDNDQQFRDIIFLMGNHEQMLLKYPDDFIRNGGTQTIESYNEGKFPRHLKNLNDLHKNIGDRHMNFYRTLKTFYEIGKVGVTHAGIDLPFLRAEGHNTDTLLWSRNLRTIAHEYYDFTVHGHTPFDRAQINAHTAYIDTGAVFGKDRNLTALFIPYVDKPDVNEMELIESETDQISKVVEV